MFDLFFSSRFLFTDYNRLSSVGGETSLAEMIATLSDACEREFGFLATRLFRVFKTEDTQGRISFLPSLCVRGGGGMDIQFIFMKHALNIRLIRYCDYNVRIF